MSAQGPAEAEMEEALASLGVTRSLLTDDERNQLDQKGYLVLEGVLTDEQLVRIRERLDALLVEEGERAGIEVMREVGTGRLADLVNKGPEFEVFFTHPRVLAAVWYLHGYRPFHLSSLNSRAAEPGQGHQGLHADGPPPAQPGVFDSCQTSWLIDPFTPDNGATRIVPGAHLKDHGPSAVMDDILEPHPDEILLQGGAGAVCIMPANMWHGGTENRSGAARRVVHAYYTLRTIEQQTNQRDYLRRETYDRLPPAARWVLDLGDKREGWAFGLSHKEWAEGAGLRPRWNEELHYPLANS